MLQAPQQHVPRVLVPVGTHISRLIGIIQIGKVTENIPGKAPMEIQKIRLTFEFPDELHSFKEGEDTKPLIHSQEFTLSMHAKSKLRPIVEGIIGTSLTDEEAYGFNIESLLNKTCLVSIKHGKTAKGSDYAKIATTSPLMKGQVAKQAFNELKVLTYENFDEKYFETLPSFIREKMKGSEEYKKIKGISGDDIDITANDVGF
jgi:hypothetical protein